MEIVKGQQPEEKINPKPDPKLVASQLHLWQLVFNKKDGIDNRQKVMEAFLQFWNDGAETLEIPGNCMLAGQIIGDPWGRFRNCEWVRTSKLVSISRVAPEGIIPSPEAIEVMGTDSADGVTPIAHGKTPLWAKTEKGNYYFFYRHDKTKPMTNLLFDLAHDGRLNEEPRHYLMPMFGDPDLM